MNMAEHMIWGGVGLAVAVRLALTLMGAQSHLSRRVEVVTPITSPMRLAEGHWLKKLGMSPYAGSAYHGSPLLLEVLGPLTNKGTDGQPTHDFSAGSAVLSFSLIINCRVHRVLELLTSSSSLIVTMMDWLRLAFCFIVIAITAKVTFGVCNAQNGGLSEGHQTYIEMRNVLKPTQPLCSFVVFLAADLIGALLLREIGGLVETAHDHYMAILQVGSLPTEKVPSISQELDSQAKLQEKTGRKNGLAGLALGDVAALLFLLNPFTIAVCVGGTTSPFENMLVILALYGAVAGNIPLATFGWAISTHLSMYPAVLIIPIALLATCGPDRPQTKVLEKGRKEVPQSQFYALGSPSWTGVAEILFWSTLWWLCIMGCCHLALGGHAHLLEMISETYGFILTVEDLSPNLGLFWYFFTEVFTHFRSFFIMVFHANVLFVIVPLTLRFRHRPLFLAFIMVAISSLLKSYPSVGDAALTLALMSLCMPELNGFRFSLLILYGYLFVAILSPSMYDLWINRGTGNANFYFAMGLLYSALQSVLIVESVGTVIRLDRRLKITVEKKRVEVTDETVQN